MANLLIVDRIKSSITGDVLGRLNLAAKVSVEDNLKVTDDNKNTHGRVTRSPIQNTPYVAACSTLDAPLSFPTPRSSVK